MRFNIKEMQGLDISSLPSFRIKEYFSRRGTDDARGDICEGDVLWFARDEFEGSFRKPKFVGTFLYRVKVLRESYGSDKQQHTFTLAMMKSSTSKTCENETFRIKGRNLYKHFCMVENINRSDREMHLSDKHDRGASARAARDERKAEKELYRAV